VTRAREPSGSSASFSKSQRILRRDEFNLVQRRGVAARCSYALVVVHRSESNAPEQAKARLGIIASRKMGGAVQRNRAKRLVREWFRHKELPSDVELVVVASAEMQGKSALEVASQLDAALNRALAKGKRPTKPKPAGPPTQATP